MRIQIDGKDILIEKKKDFVLQHIFECGQCFRWNKIDKYMYEGVAQGHYLKVKEEEETNTIFKYA